MYTFALSHHFSCLQNTEKHRQHRCFSIIQCATSCAADTGPEHLALATPARSAVPSESTSGPFINMETRATISRSLNAAAHQIKMCGAHRDLIILPIGRPLEQKGKHVISFCLIAQTDTQCLHCTGGTQGLPNCLNQSCLFWQLLPKVMPGVANRL